MPFDLWCADMRIDPTPRIETLFSKGFVGMAAMSARTIIAMIMRVMVLSANIPMFIVFVERMALHVYAAMEIAVGLMDECA